MLDKKVNGGYATEATQQSILSALGGSSADAVDANNSTTATLGAGASYVGTYTDVTTRREIALSAFADQDSAASGLTIEWSSDGTNVDVTDVYDLVASTGKSIRVGVKAQFYRVNYTNGASVQGAFRLETILRNDNGSSDMSEVEDGVAAKALAGVSKAVLFGDNSGTPIAITADGSGNAAVADSAGNALLTTIDADTGGIATSTASVDTKTPALGQAAMAASVPVAIASDQSAVPISASSLPLPTGAATSALQTSSEAILTTIDADTGAIAGSTASVDTKTPALGAAVTASSTPVNIASDQVVPISASALPLPSGAATEAKQDTGNTSLATIAGDTTSLDGKVTACNTGAVTISSALPAGTNTIGSVTLNYLNTVDFMDTPLLDASSTNIPASASAPVTVVASLAAAVSKVYLAETTGNYIGLYSDPAGTPVLEGIFPPGAETTLEISLAASTVLGLRNMENATITSGNVIINFLG